MDERVYWLGFTLFTGIGPKRFAMVLEAFGSAKTAWAAETGALAASGIGKKTTADFIAFRETLRLEAYLERLTKSQVRFVTLDEENYPPLLKKIANPPFVLFYRGRIESLSVDRTIAIVGTRNVTSYGTAVTEQITAGLVSGGFVIVSGLAYGVDAVAHRTTIIAGGKTVAVLGCGIDCCSPREHTGLYAEIITSGGAVVSEYPLGMAPTRGSFPSRNRIIAGLSQAVILTEGAADSGALYTANEAFANDRPVFAVPGPVTSSLSAAPFALINRGGTLITGADDVLRSLGEKHLISKTREKRIGETPQEQKIIDALQYEQLHFDEIVKKVNLDTIEVGRLLSLMELKGFIKSEGGFYVLI